MEDKRLVATKNDIIIFFVFAFSFTIISFMYMNLEEILSKGYICLIYFIQPIITIIINIIIKYMNIKNRTILFVIKIIFYIFTILSLLFYASLSIMLYIIYKGSSELTLNIIQNFIC